MHTDGAFWPPCLWDGFFIFFGDIKPERPGPCLISKAGWEADSMAENSIRGTPGNIRYGW